MGVSYRVFWWVGTLLIASRSLARFADDSLIFSHPDQDHIQSLKALLLCFEAVYGLTVNLSRSEIVLVALFPLFMIWQTFSDLIFELDLIDLPLGGGGITCGQMEGLGHWIDFWYLLHANFSNSSQK